MRKINWEINIVNIVSFVDLNLFVHIKLKNSSISHTDCWMNVFKLHLSFSLSTEIQKCPYNFHAFFPFYRLYFYTSGFCFFCATIQRNRFQFIFIVESFLDHSQAEVSFFFFSFSFSMNKARVLSSKHYISRVLILFPFSPFFLTFSFKKRSINLTDFLHVW